MEKHLKLILLIGAAIALVACSQGFKAAGNTKLASVADIGTKTCSSGIYTNTDLYRRNSQLISNGLNDLFGAAFVTQILPQLESLPKDKEKDINFEKLRMSITASQVNAYFELANSVSEKLIASSTAIKPFLSAGCDFSVSLSDVCLVGFLDNLIPRLLARPLSSETQNLLSGIYRDAPGTASEKFSALLLATFQLPDLYYQDLRSNQPAAYLVAGELARLIWYSFPDSSLLAKAKSGELLQTDVLQEEINRMMADTKARRLVREFSEQWLELEKLPDLTGYSADFLNGLTLGSNLRNAMTEDIVGFVEHIVFTKNGSFRDLMLSRDGKITHSGLASMYGTSVSADWTQLPENRAGILSRAAFLASGNNEPGVIGRGVKLNRSILCNEIPDPPVEAIDMRPEGLDQTKYSNREFTDLRTAGTSCMGCHSSINPLGHVLGSYDALGRFVITDRIFSGTGAYVRSFPVNANATIRLDGQLQSLSGSVDLSNSIANSHQGVQCFSRQVVRFIGGQREESKNDCAIENIRTQLNDNTPILKVITQQVVSELNVLLSRLPAN